MQDEVEMNRDLKKQHHGGRALLLWLVLVVLGALAVVWLVSVRPVKRGITPAPVQQISYAEAAKAIALSQTDQQTCFQLSLSGVAEEERSSWYAPYLACVREYGWFLDVSAEDALTIGELDKIASDMGLLPDIREASRAALACLPVEAEGFWRLYEQICAVSGVQEEVRAFTATVYGTTATVTGAPAWTAYTDQGILSYSGLELDDCSDKTVRLLQRDGEILHLEQVVSEEVIYPNVWLVSWREENLRVYLNGIYRNFSFAEGDETYGERIADISIEAGCLKEVVPKEEEIRGKILSVTDEAIEIAGYGSIPVQENARFYKVYGNLEMQDISDVLVGYEIQRFTLDNGEICAGVTTQTFRAENIRVLLRNNGFAGLFHDEVTVSGFGDYYLCYGNTKEFHAAGESVTLTPESTCFQSGRVIIKTAQENRGIRITSITRNQGNPVYKGTLELNCYEEGLTIVNELLLEDYLRKVVPSEVPSTYGQEALNAQAICARSYGWLEIRENSLRQYGAHVDDSENYQVYNNLDENEAATQAVQNTYGQVLTFEGNVVPTYYFSTSWGNTTDPSIWGSAPDAVPYLQPVEVTGSAYGLRQTDGSVNVGVQTEGLDLTKEEDFRKFMENPPETAYERECEWFRWTVDVTLSQLTESLSQGLPERVAADGAYILYEQADGSFAPASELTQIPELGEVQSLTVSKRIAGGSVQELLIRGSGACVKLTRQGNVRTLLGNTDYVYQNQNGSSSGNRELLQSSFFWLEELYNGETLTGYRIHGGGKGHGLGMPQNAMNAMSQSGLSAAEILNFFYPGTVVETVY